MLKAYVCLRKGCVQSRKDKLSFRFTSSHDSLFSVTRTNDCWMTMTGNIIFIPPPIQCWRSSRNCANPSLLKNSKEPITRYCKPREKTLNSYRPFRRLHRRGFYRVLPSGALGEPSDTFIHFCAIVRQ